MFRAILKERGQITIPAKLRKILTLKSGDILEVEVRGGCLVLKPLQLVERQVETEEDAPGGPAA